MIADLTSSGVQSGCAALTSAIDPATCGEDIDVPAIAMNRFPAGPLSAVVWSGWGVVPARTWTPGALMSGLIQSPVGPREENEAMMSPWVGDATPVAHAASTFVWPLTKFATAFEANCVWIAGR